jgi:class 3 adenylate cyclase
VEIRARPGTVVFCDETGSTALGERLDPESLRDVQSRYFDAMRTAIERHGEMPYRVRGGPQEDLRGQGAPNQMPYIGITRAATLSSGRLIRFWDPFGTG